MTLNEFIVKYNGVGNVGNTSENKGECVGLVMVYLKDQGLPHIWGHGFSLLTNADPEAYEVIKNTPDGVPQPGDVIVWTQGFNDTYGHTAIVVKATVNTFEVFEQNVPTGSPCRLHTYKNYAYVDGWLRKRAIIAQHIAQHIAQLPQYFETLLQENKLDLNNEGQIRTFFQKAIDFDGVKTDLNNAEKVIASKNKLIQQQTKDLIALKASIAPETDDTDLDTQLAPIVSKLLGWLRSKLGS